MEKTRLDPRNMDHDDTAKESLREVHYLYRKKLKSMADGEEKQALMQEFRVVEDELRGFHSFRGEALIALYDKINDVYPLVKDQLAKSMGMLPPNHKTQS